MAVDRTRCSGGRPSAAPALGGRGSHQPSRRPARTKVISGGVFARSTVAYTFPRALRPAYAPVAATSSQSPSIISRGGVGGGNGSISTSSSSVSVPTELVRVCVPAPCPCESGALTFAVAFPASLIAPAATHVPTCVPGPPSPMRCEIFSSRSGKVSSLRRRLLGDPTPQDRHIPAARALAASALDVSSEPSSASTRSKCQKRHPYRPRARRLIGRRTASVFRFTHPSSLRTSSVELIGQNTLAWANVRECPPSDGPLDPRRENERRERRDSNPRPPA
jgi:hypothetical protein